MLHLTQLTSNLAHFGACGIVSMKHPPSRGGEKAEAGHGEHTSSPVINTHLPVGQRKWLHKAMQGHVAARMLVPRCSLQLDGDASPRE
jgi:hypothetical protein